MSAGHVQQPLRSVTRPSAAVAVRRSWLDVGVLVAALVLLLLASVAASDRSVPGWERSAFAAVNGPSSLPFAVVWPVMQLGNVVTVVVAALLAGVRGRRRLAVGVLGAGLSAYVLAKAVKAVVERPRPAGLLDDVHVRGPEVLGQGFVSGHTVVATVVVAVLLPWVPRRARWLLAALAVAVGLARVQVGAHLPLDVLGGAALGVAVAALTHLLLGRPAGAAHDDGPAPRRGRARQAEPGATAGP